MKKQLLTAAAVLLAVCGYAQTKGTNALSIGVNSQTTKSDYTIASGSSTTKQKYNNFTLGYGHFISDNTKLGIELSYLNGKNTSTGGTQDNKTEGFGGSVSYQKYYPLIGKFYAYAGATAGFSTSELKYDDTSLNRNNGTDTYAAGAYGGITWFISKRWAFETRLLSATGSYAVNEQSDSDPGGAIYKNTQTTFNLSTNGFINDLGFKIYLLF